MGGGGKDISWKMHNTLYQVLLVSFIRLKFLNCFQEQEARTALLRGRATRKQLRDGSSHDKAVVTVDNKSQHLNLFADIEEKVCVMTWILS